MQRRNFSLSISTNYFDRYIFMYLLYDRVFHTRVNRLLVFL